MASVLFLDFYADHPSYEARFKSSRDRFRQKKKREISIFCAKIFGKKVDLKTVFMENIFSFENGLLFQKWDLIIAGGSPFHTEDAENKKWISASLSLFLDFYASTFSTPFLAICFAHQLFAESLGGAVSTLLKEHFGRSFFVPLTGKFAGQKIPVWAANECTVSRAPKEATLFAHSEKKAIDPFSFLHYSAEERRIFTIQSHPENISAMEGEEDGDLISFFQECLLA